MIGFSDYNLNADSNKVSLMQDAIASKYHITPWLFLVPVGVIFMIVKKMPPIPALLIGTLAGGLFAMILTDIINELGGLVIILNHHT